MLVAPISSAGRGLVAAAHQHRAVGRDRSAAAPRSPSRGSCGTSSVVGFCNGSASDIAGISTGKPPACQTPRFTSSTRCLKCAWQELMSRPGVDDRDHRLAGVVAAVVAHLRGARAMAERAQVVRAVPAVAAQLFGLLSLYSNFAPDSLTTLAHFACSLAQPLAEALRRAGAHLGALLGEALFHVGGVQHLRSARVQLHDTCRAACRAVPPRPGTSRSRSRAGPAPRPSACPARSGTRCALEIASARSRPPCTVRPGGEHAVEQHVAPGPPTTPATASEPPL